MILSMSNSLIKIEYLIYCAKKRCEKTKQKNLQPININVYVHINFKTNYRVVVLLKSLRIQNWQGMRETVSFSQDIMIFGNLPCTNKQNHFINENKIVKKLKP